MIFSPLTGIAYTMQHTLEGHDLRNSFRPLGVLSWMSVVTLHRLIHDICHNQRLSEYSILPLKSRGKSLYEIIMHFLITILIAMTPHMVIIIVLGLVLPYHYRFRLQTSHLVFQMTSRKALFWRKVSINQKGCKSPRILFMF